MENNNEHSQSHQEHEVQTLVERIEQMEITKEDAKKAEAESTLDDLKKTV
jgi:hypothetical protein